MRTFRDHIETTSTQDLEEMLSDSSEMIQAIKAELARRRAQHEQIEQLDTLLAETRPKFHEVRDFFRSVLEELRGREDRS